MNYLEDLWNNADAAKCDDAELLRYRSNLLGSDPRLTNYGGGNTSAKLREIDPITGAEVTVLWVKGSGGDLGTIRRDGFATLYQDKVEALRNRYRGDAFEDEMVGLYPLCAFGLNGRAPSIDTPLHAFLPFAHVDHLHPDWAIALAASANGPALLRELEEQTGIRLLWLPWKRPGFELGLWLEKAVREQPDCDGVILASHGLFTWGDTSKACYENTLAVLNAVGTYVVPKVEAGAATLFGGAVTPARDDRSVIARRVLPLLRGLFEKNVICHFDDRSEVLRFVGSRDAELLAERGTSCPDHFLRTRVRPLFVKWDGDTETLEASVRASLPGYRAEYAAYYERNKEADSPKMRGADPTVVLLPGVGLFSFGVTKAEARVTGEFYVNAIHVMEGATSFADGPAPAADVPESRIFHNYVSLPEREAFRIEYWALEEAKLQRMPAEREMARKVALIVGAGPGIGRAAARQMLDQGAHVFLADLVPAMAEEAKAELVAEYGKDRVDTEIVDISSRESVRGLLDSLVLRFGGLDVLAIVAAVFIAPDEKGNLPDGLFRKTLDVNITGSFIAAEEGARLMQEQGKKGGSIVLVSSANAVVSKKGSIAYDISKSAVNHLIRELAVTYAGSGIRVNGVAPATVVEGSRMFPKDRVIASLAKYNLPYSEEEEEDVLRTRLADFYAKRTLLGRSVTPREIARAIYLLASPVQLPLTTGQILPVDAGLQEAFLR